MHALEDTGEDQRWDDAHRRQRREIIAMDQVVRPVSYPDLLHEVPMRSSAVAFKNLCYGVRLIAREKKLRDLLEAPAFRCLRKDPDQIKPLFIPFPGWRVVVQEQVLNRRYSFVVPGDEDHAVHSHSSRNKRLLFAL